ncbi:F0F1 ATP synthase subunit delta [Pseudoramibacter sp.]|jgi:F0F1-type ATP synthase delta subunit|uniref:F0F1 ATP synthase subunit delta n=1 Tax=Pseudoramibacter sp. TaxID=2034862 RepID=UPI0025DC1796|nr:F0F1 ATP synthase subunit delta [Pseudoramibacter sp.]MCH4072531.1 F0F1 ATP synthase subunit delta [Pseudoramibacter sp.]MCH4106302.1 F0F1 ATP synthase subunit delta [Pseudoramibacter sp.]
MERFVNQQVINDAKVIRGQQIQPETLKECQAILNQNPKLIQILSNPTINTKAKANIIEQIFPKEVVPTFVILCRHGQFKDIQKVLATCSDLSEIEAGTGHGTLWYAGEKPDQKLLAQLVFDKFGVRDIQWKEIYDPSLIGGFRIRIRDFIYDHSVAGSFKEINAIVRTHKRR